MVHEWMIPVYGWAIKAGLRTLESIPKRYQEPVAKWLMEQEEAEAAAKRAAEKEQ